MMRLDGNKLDTAVRRKAFKEDKSLTACYEEIGNSTMVMKNLKKGKFVNSRTLINVMVWLGQTDLKEFLIND